MVTDDLGGTTTQVISLYIFNENDLPILIGGKTSVSGLEDNGAISGAITALAKNGLTDRTYFTVSTAASNSTATINTDTGLWSYTQSAKYTGSEEFTVTVTDDIGGKTIQVVSLPINAVD